MNNFIQTRANPNIVCEDVGRMTPNEKELALKRAKLNAEVYCNFLRWFINDAKHPAYKNVQDPEI